MIIEDTDIDDGAREVLVFQLEDVVENGDYTLGTDTSGTVTIQGRCLRPHCCGAVGDLDRLGARPAISARR